MDLSVILKLSEPQEKWHAGILHNFIKIMWLPYIWCSKLYLLLRMLELKASHLVWLLLLQRWKEDLRGKGVCLDLLMVLESLIILLLCLLLVGTTVAQISPKTSDSVPVETFALIFYWSSLLLLLAQSIEKHSALWAPSTSHSSGRSGLSQEIFVSLILVFPSVSSWATVLFTL